MNLFDFILLRVCWATLMSWWMFSSNMQSLWLFFLQIFFQPYLFTLLLLGFPSCIFCHAWWSLIFFFFIFLFFNYCPWNIWTVLMQFQDHNFSFLSAQIYCCSLFSGLVILVIVLFNFRISIWPHNLYLICFHYLEHYCSMFFIIYALFI